MRDPLVVRVAKLTCVALIVWVLLAWISGQAKMSIWQNSAPSLIPNNDQFHSTQLIIPNIQQNPSSPYSSTTTMSKIAKVTMVYYQNTTNDTILYEDALRSHKAHNDQHGYLHHVLRRSLLSIQYSKPAYVLSVILQELVKPPGERLEWLVWHDADLILMNSEISLESFLPPPEFSHIDLIVTNDLGGLNSGVFFIRVSEWAVTYLTASISYRSWDPNFPTMNEEQAIMDGILQREPWKSHVMHVPQRWFNSYEDRGSDDDLPPEWNWYDHAFKPGYLVVHVPGTGVAKNGLMREWIGKKAAEPKKYNVHFWDTNYANDIASFWETEAAFEVENQKVFWRRLKVIQTIGPVADRARDEAVEELKAMMKGHEEEIKAEVEAKLKEYRKHKVDYLREAERAEARKSAV